MRPGQRLTSWWQDLIAGRLRTPQAIYAASRLENIEPTEDRFTQDPVDNPEWDVPKRLRAVSFMAGPSYASQLQRADWRHADSRLRLLFARVVVRAGKLGIPLYVHCSYRGKDEQNRLRLEGKSKVGYPFSAHNIGEAVDLVHGVFHWNLTGKEWQFLYHLVTDELRKLNATLPRDRKLSLNWGGDDGTDTDGFRWDPAHWEIADYRKRRRALPNAAPVHLMPAAIIAKG